MAACTNRPGDPGASRPAGILRPDELARHTDLLRRAPSAALAPWVEHHWTLRWSLPPGTRFDSQTLPHPAGNLTVELGRTRPEVGADPVVVTGVVTRRFDVELSGAGFVHGARFRPGGLAALLGADASAWTDRTVPARDVAPEVLTAGIVEALAATDPDVGGEVAAYRFEQALGPLAAAAAERPDVGYATVRAVVEAMHDDPTLLRVADIEARHQLAPRTLTRLFARYVGVGPKWVLARYRMHDVVTALDDGYDGPLADLAAELGFADQSHFTRDFTRLVGVPPSRYRSPHRSPGALTADSQAAGPG